MLLHVEDVLYCITLHIFQVMCSGELVLLSSEVRGLAVLSTLMVGFREYIVCATLLVARRFEHAATFL
jgi:hypothetical protein